MMGNGFGVAILTTTAAMAIYSSAIPSSPSSISPDLVSTGIRNAFIIGTVIMVIALILISLTWKKHEIKEDQPQPKDSGIYSHHAE